MTKLVETIKAGPAESGMGHYRDYGQGTERKDPLFGISGKKGVGPYSKQSQNLQGLSISNAIINQGKEKRQKSKVAETATVAAQAAEQAKYTAEHPAPIQNQAGDTTARRRTAARAQRSGGRLSTVLSESQGLG